MKDSFKYALRGIAKAFASERNMKVHALALLLAIIAGFYFHISGLEWITIIICSGMVFCAEIINTAIEEIVDFISPEKHEKAALIKDLSAGAVLIAAIAAIIIAGIVFIPKFI
jgi:diacylglycerol kinase